MDLTEWMQQHYGATVADLSGWWANQTRHGCFCGAGTRCQEAIDGLDRLCAAHDDAYRAVGVSGDDLAFMFSCEGLMLTVEADTALATGAESADLKADDPHSAPDVEDYRRNLVWLFSTRATIGATLRRVRDAIEGFRKFLADGASQWILADAATPESVVTGFRQHVAYLESLGVGSEQAAGVAQEFGVDPASSGLA